MKNLTNECLRTELINQLILTLYKDNPEQREYLEYLTEEELDQMMGNYYLYDVERIYKNINK